MITWQETLVIDRLKGKRENTSRLRSAMLKAGIKKECAKCSCKTYRLHVNHINGDKLNNEKYNLNFLCGLCHPKPPKRRFRKKPTTIMDRLIDQAKEEIQKQCDEEVFRELNRIANI
jgi:hypothetical protein